MAHSNKRISTIASSHEVTFKRTPEEEKAFQEEQQKDSIRLIQLLKQGLCLADRNKTNKSFHHKSDSLEVSFGYLFSTTNKHLIIRRNYFGEIRNDLYLFQDSVFKKVGARKTSALAYLGDTLQDVNGDGRSDYLFRWYPECGCCERNVYAVFLQTDSGYFSKEIEFINPHFYPEQKLIRGLCYGHNAPLYTYKWRGFHVDTIEYIFFPNEQKGSCYLRKKHNTENEKGEILHSLPNAYKQMGYGNGANG